MIQIEDEEFNVEACIQFTLLQKILDKLLYKQQLFIIFLNSYSLIY